MIKRVFSRQTFNGYHIVSLKGEGEDERGLLLGKKSSEIDEDNGCPLVDEDDIPECPNKGKVNPIARPWGEFIYTPSLCQKCIWLYQTPDSEYDCILLSKDKRIKSTALVNGTG